MAAMAMVPSQASLEETMDDITARQRRILEFIRKTVQERGYPPTVREIGEAVGLTSSSSVHAQLANLQRRGLIKRDPSKPRAMELRGPGSSRRGGGNVPPVGSVAPRGPGVGQPDARGQAPGPSP